MKVMEVLSRIKWGVVIIILIAVLALAVVYAKFNPFDNLSPLKQPEYKGTEYLKVRSGANPDTINIDGKSTVWVEIKNTGEKEHSILINLTTYDDKLKFLDSESGNITESIKIGPMESRRLEFKVKLFEAKYGGDYGIDITVRPDKNLEPIKDIVFIHVSSTKE